MATTRIRITYDGQLALTTAQAAERYVLTPVTIRKAISRLGLDPLDETLDGRTPLYLAEDLDRAMAARPGRGNHGSRRRATGAMPPTALDRASDVSPSKRRAAKHAASDAMQDSTA